MSLSKIVYGRHLAKDGQWTKRQNSRRKIESLRNTIRAKHEQITLKVCCWSQEVGSNMPGEQSLGRDFLDEPQPVPNSEPWSIRSRAGTRREVMTVRGTAEERCRAVALHTCQDFQLSHTSRRFSRRQPCRGGIKPQRGDERRGTPRRRRRRGGDAPFLSGLIRQQVCVQRKHRGRKRDLPQWKGSDPISSASYLCTSPKRSQAGLKRALALAAGVWCVGKGLRLSQFRAVRPTRKGAGAVVQRVRRPGARERERPWSN